MITSKLPDGNKHVAFTLYKNKQTTQKQPFPRNNKQKHTHTHTHTHGFRNSPHIFWHQQQTSCLSTHSHLTADTDPRPVRLEFQGKVRPWSCSSVTTRCFWMFLEREMVKVIVVGFFVGAIFCLHHVYVYILCILLIYLYLYLFPSVDVSPEVCGRAKFGPFSFAKGPSHLYRCNHVCCLKCTWTRTDCIRMHKISF